MRLIPSVEDLAQNANVNWWSPDQKKHKLFKKGGFENFRGRVRIDDVIFNYIIRAGKASFGDVFYDINLEVDQILPHTKRASEIKKSTSNDSISESGEKTTSKRNSLKIDTEGRSLTEQQREFFKDAKTVDAEGKLKPFYHGTGRADRVGYTFRADRATSGPMAYFTDSQQIADNYARDKQDTSLEYDEMYDDYYSQFRVEINGKLDQ